MNLISFGIFGVLFLIILSIVSNSSTESLRNIEEQVFLINCPLPIYDGIAVLNSINGYSINYTVTHGNTTEGDGTLFICSIDSITGAFTASTVIKPYGSASFFDVIPIGWLGYVADTITSAFDSVYHVFVLLSFFITPTNFNILGFTLDDLTGQALFMVIAIYGLCYIAIGILIYKVVSPFSGAG